MSKFACYLMSYFKKNAQINSKILNSGSKQHDFVAPFGSCDSDIVSSASHAPSHVLFVTHFISTTGSIVLQSTTV